MQQTANVPTKSWERSYIQVKKRQIQVSYCVSYIFHLNLFHRHTDQAG